MNDIFFTESIIHESKGAKGLLTPASREALILTLLETLGHNSATPLTRQILCQIDAQPPVADPTLREVRLLKLAFALVDYGLRLAAASPLNDAFSTGLHSVLLDLQRGDHVDARKSTDIALEVMEMMEAALTGDRQSIPDTPRTERLLAMMRDRLASLPPSHA